jgi:hypothetical protein
MDILWRQKSGGSWFKASLSKMLDPISNNKPGTPVTPAMQEVVSRRTEV